jgi:CMP-N-acetylneuraminic acid synthetase
MSSLPGPVWAVVPARGGSKSIPLKNLIDVAGRPLLDYGVMAAKASGICDRIIGSTDDDRIAARLRDLGLEVDRRPTELGGDNTPVLDVIRDLLARQSTASNAPWLIVLVQPTSPFLLPSHVEGLVRLMAERQDAKSGQTVTLCPHNHHAWNQREVVDGMVHFVYQAEREAAYNKQAKPQRWVFGNLLVTTAATVNSGDSLFSVPSVAYPIETPYDFDLDAVADVKLAAALVTAGVVKLPHVA